MNTEDMKTKKIISMLLPSYVIIYYKIECLHHSDITVIEREQENKTTFGKEGLKNQLSVANY